MSKVVKISIIFVIIFNLFIVVSNAETTNIYNDVVNEEVEESLSEEFSSDDISDDELLADEDEDFDLFDNQEKTSEEVNSSYYTPTYATGISTMSSISEANLGLNNVLCIILIAIGILIILLAIAILIRLKK